MGARPPDAEQKLVGPNILNREFDVARGRKLDAIVAHADLRRVDETLAAHAEASAEFRGIRHVASH